jgi:hypothetical protein
VAKTPLLVTGFAVLIPPDYDRQHLLVNIDSRKRAALYCCRFHGVSLRLAKAAQGRSKFSVTPTRSACSRGSSQAPALILTYRPPIKHRYSLAFSSAVNDLGRHFGSNTIFIPFLARAAGN